LDEGPGFSLLVFEGSAAWSYAAEEKKSESVGRALTSGLLRVSEITIKTKNWTG
jgi:hypothetical protein